MKEGKRERGKGKGKTKRHVVLIGLPGSGKTTVGRLAAPELGATFADVDEEIERTERRTVLEIFTEKGEAAFRALERAWVDRLLGTSPSVIAPGGGWAAQPGHLESVRGRGFLVYLETSPEKAGQRVASQRHRPLLAGGAPHEKMRDLYAARRAFYERAGATVETDRRTAEEVAREVVALARSLGGW